MTGRSTGDKSSVRCWRRIVWLGGAGREQRCHQCSSLALPKMPRQTKMTTTTTMIMMMIVWRQVLSSWLDGAGREKLVRQYSWQVQKTDTTKVTTTMMMMIMTMTLMLMMIAEQ